MAAAAAQVRGYTTTTTTATATRRDGRTSRTPAPSAVKLERRDGSQSLCSSSSELLADSSSSVSSPSSSSTLSLASAAAIATAAEPQAASRATNNNNVNNRYHRQPSRISASGASPQVSSSPREGKSLQQRQPLTWRQSSIQLNSSRSFAVPDLTCGGRRLSRASLSSGSGTSYTNGNSNESSRSNSSKLAAHPITASQPLAQRRDSKPSTNTQRSSAIINRRARSSATTTTTTTSTAANKRHLQLHYGSLSSIPSQQLQLRCCPQSNQAAALALSGDPSFRRHHYSLSSSLLKRIDDVRGRQHLGARHQSLAQQRRQPQVRQTTRSSSVQQLQFKAAGSSLASSGAPIAANTKQQQQQQQPASSATTNSRLRQAALYARRHSHITPTPTPTRETTTPTTTTGRCPLIINNLSLTRGISTASKASSSLDYHAPSSPPRIGSTLRISRVAPSADGSSSSRRISCLPFQRLDQNQRKISSSAFSLASSTSSLLSSNQHQQQRLNAAKRVKAANDSRAARDRQALESRRKTATTTTALNHLPIGTKSSWRSNLQQQQQQHQIAAATKMTTALASNNIKFHHHHQQHQSPAVGKKSGERSDGRSSSSSGSSSASDSCSSSCSDNGDCSSSTNDENVQPPPVSRNHLTTRADNSSASGATIDPTNVSNSAGVCCGNGNSSNGHNDIDHTQQPIGQNLIESSNIIREITANNNEQLLAAVVAAAAAAVNTSISTLAVGATVPMATATSIDTADSPFKVATATVVDDDHSCCQPLTTSESGILVARDFSLNISQNNNNTKAALTVEEGTIKRPLSDIEINICGDSNNKGQKLETDSEMTNVKIKIQRKLSIGPDVLIKTEPICLHYDLEARPFARGKFAQVKRCVSKGSKQCFAAKCIKKRRRLVDIRHEIMLEIEALKLSYHTDHIVKLYEVFETPTEMILILEMANGGELQRVIDDEEAIEEKLVKRMIRQILEGLVQLHDNDIAHLDIKPQNLLLTEPFPGGDVKLCDFGISRRITKDCEIREICGTPDYVAPEILRYDPISLATDMWSLGVLTYVLLTGYSPFGSENKQQTFCNITQATLDFPSEIFYKISEDAVDFMQKLIVREPSERLTSHQAKNHPWLCQ